MSRRIFIASLAALMFTCNINTANAFFFSRESVKTTIQRIVEALENENIPALTSCISPRFLAGNPEIPGRIEDAFEKFDSTRITYKIAGIREADGIATVKLNWTKTTTNPMNNWTYRDIGSDVVMHFNAESPYQLVGLEDANLFGISFLLTTRIVIPAPDEKRLEMARKELEMAERKAALEREQAEREAAQAEERRKRRELEEAKRQAKADLEKQVLEEKKQAREEKKLARQKELEEKQARIAEEKAKQEEAAEKAKGTPPMPGSDLTADEMSKLIALEAVIKEAIGDIPGHAATTTLPPDQDMSKAIRDKAEQDARRMLRTTPSYTSGAQDVIDDATAVISPELEAWRREKLRELRAAQAPPLTQTAPATTDEGHEAITTLQEIEESTRIQAELREKTNIQAVQMLAEQRAREMARPAADTEDEIKSDPEKMASERDQDLLLAKAEAEARAQAVLDEIARLQQDTQPSPPTPDKREQLLETAKREARERAEAELAALRKTTQWMPEPLPQPKSEQEAPLSLDEATLQRIEEEARMQAAIRAKAEDDARALAIQRRLDTLTNIPSEALAKIMRERPDSAQSESLPDAQSPALAPEQTQEQLQEEIRKKAEADALALKLSLATNEHAVAPQPQPQAVEARQQPPPTPATPVPTSAPPSTVSTLPALTSTSTPTHVVSKTEVSTSAPPLALAGQPSTNATTQTQPEKEIARQPLKQPEMAIVRGREQPGGPQHDFQVSRFEITNEEFAEFLNDAIKHPYNARGSNMFFDDEGNVYMDGATNRAKRLFAMTDLDFGGIQKGLVFENDRYVPSSGMARHPVAGVSWYGALKYCNWLTISEGLGENACAYTEGADPEKWHPSTLSDEEWHNGFSDVERQAWLDHGIGYRLPMNSYNTTTGRFNEFYAAAAWDGSANRAFAFGRDTLTEKDANYSDSNSPFKGGTTPVGWFDGSDHDGKFATSPNQNPYGIYDLSGNVWEWSNDTTGHPGYRALFGGAFDGDEDTLKTTFRGSLNPYRVCDNVGFRVVITPAQPK